MKTLAGLIPPVSGSVPPTRLMYLKESGFGRTLARILTEQANTSYHHGLFEQSQPKIANPLSRWLAAGTVSMGFQGRLKYRPVEKYPVRPSEVKQALQQAEKKLRLAFELDTGNYAAYDVYLFSLRTRSRKQSSLRSTELSSRMRMATATHRTGPGSIRPRLR